MDFHFLFYLNKISILNNETKKIQLLSNFLEYILCKLKFENIDLDDSCCVKCTTK
ncbi:hypothetical protein BACI348_40975 [Bacillus altitudinis]|uniref:Uncharacterized protein n=1 Tax=Bacillus altitudinis TaxID=293387 RepID=A0A653RHQ7_BACAB|nr:hypothetical protein BACI348_40975 [Bacillus altitudinis]